MNANQVRSAVPMDRPPDHVPEPAKKPDRTELLRLSEKKWEELEECRIREEELADAGLLVHPLIPRRVRLSYEYLAIITELRRMAAQQLLEQNTVAGQSSTQVACGEGKGENRSKKPLVDVSSKAPAVETTTTDPITMSRGLIQHTWEALERCRFGEELLDEKGLPTLCLAHPLAQLSRAMVAFVREDQRIDEQAFFVKHVVGGEGSPPAALSDTAKTAMKVILQQFALRDRRVLRQLLDRARPAETSSSAEGSAMPIIGSPAPKSSGYSGKLPAYARHANRERVIKLLCKGRCSKTRWAEMDIDYPGQEILQKLEPGNFSATCLFCGYVAQYSYNWYRP